MLKRLKESIFYNSEENTISESVIYSSEKLTSVSD